MYHASKKLCPVCGMMFQTHHPAIKFCSKICREIARENARVDGLWKIQRAIYGRYRWELKRKAIRPITTAFQLLGCTVQEFKRKLEDQFQSGMNWNNYGKWHIDHIRPIAMFDLTDFEQQRQCFHFSNFQPLWAKDNLRKRKTSTCNL